MILDTVLSAGIPSLAVIVAAWIGSRGQKKTHEKVDAVKHEVTTLNGKTIAVLAEEGEERRTEA